MMENTEDFLNKLVFQNNKKKIPRLRQRKQVNSIYTLNRRVTFLIYKNDLVVSHCRLYAFYAKMYKSNVWLKN